MCYMTIAATRSDIWVYLVVWMPLAYDHFEYCYCLLLELVDIVFILVECFISC